MAGPFSVEVPELLQSDFDALAVGSGLSLDVIRERGYRSVLGRAELANCGFKTYQRRYPGLLLPVCPPDGSNGLYTYRPGKPRHNPSGKPLKYEMPAGFSSRLDVPSRCRPMLADPRIPLWFTEGPKKGDALATHGFCAVDLLGVNNFKGKNDFGGVTLLADFDLIAWNGRTVNIVFDSDVMTKAPVRKALERLTEHCQRKGAIVNPVYLPNLPDGSKCGVDDYLLTHSTAELEALISAPRPAPKAAAPMVELLDMAPASLSRPMQLVNGRAYAVVWLWTRSEVRESLDKAGNVVSHNPPIVRTEKRQFIVRDDGAIFGDGGDKPLEELGLQVEIPAVPRDAKLWSAAGVKRYRAGDRPNPLCVFTRIVATVDRFLSFDRSLSDQVTMCELVACYSLATWFLDAFDVMGFLWPNGGYGSGKTKLGLLVCEVAHLGEALLSGSSYATLRDMADLGATLLFDDAETIADAKKADPDKRNLLLAGNRRGTVVALKEAGPNGVWKTRFVNAYCPRLFTAIRLPDAVLASRTIVIPLIRTADPRKANAEVLDHSLWPCDHRRLLDDLWAVALANLAGMPAHQAAVNANAPLVGRNLEPWRALLSVAHWLDGSGVPGLYERMCELARSYQTERVDLEAVDITRLVVQALVEMVPFVPNVPFVPFSRWGVPIEFDVSDVVDKVNQIAIDQDLTDGNNPDYTTPKKVGWVLRKLRVQRAARTARGKRWQISPDALNNLAAGYGVPLPFAAPCATPPEETAQTARTAQTTQPDFEVF